MQKTIKIKGDDNSKINIGGNNKSGFTLVLTISAAGLFLKPILISKGKTKRSLKKFNVNDKILGTYSNNGWINRGIMKIALNNIHNITKGKRAVLLLDQFKVHTDEFVLKEATKLNIKLIFVPIGKTSILQPLDVSINGILKEKAKRLWKQERINNPEKSVTVSDGIKHFLSVANEIKKNVIIKAFKKSCFDKKYIKV